MSTLVLFWLCFCLMGLVVPVCKKIIAAKHERRQRALWEKEQQMSFARMEHQQLEQLTASAYKARDNYDTSGKVIRYFAPYLDDDEIEAAQMHAKAELLKTIKPLMDGQQ